MIRYSNYVVSIPNCNVNIKLYDQNSAFKLAHQVSNQFNQPININKNMFEDSIVLTTKLATINPVK